MGKLIIYRHQETGEATDWTPANKCPDGWKFIKLDENIRKIEDIDKDDYHEQKFLNLKNQKIINESSRKFLADNDWKIIAHIRHLKLVELGELTQASLTDQEYMDLLIECQRQADLVIE